METATLNVCIHANSEADCIPLTLAPYFSTTLNERTASSALISVGALRLCGSADLRICGSADLRMGARARGREGAGALRLCAHTRVERKAGTLAETGFRLIHCSIIEDDRHNYALVFYKPKANATVGLG
ncbi:hypothetical protein RR48_14347 [Papilio machaon]|uniref:Uncharacterized protein n=1 Tax=Papilio machaon TaxID=76193 RepID=A0A194QM33_PAPMA|nr:hypothetical protein RR48_14347 [Papilio machaon]